MSQAPTIVWFDRDLRLADNPALAAAAHGPVIPVYILDDAGPRRGGAARWWLRENLANLAQSLDALGVPLLLKRGRPAGILPALAAATGARTVRWTRRYEPSLAARDADVAARLNDAGIETVIHAGFLLFDPEKIRTGAGAAFKIFTPFSKACFAVAPPPAPVPAPRRLQGVAGLAGQTLAGETLADWRLVPAQARWPQGLAQAWRPGEQAAGQRLAHFAEELMTGYRDLRDRPDLDATSRLSPYLACGALSPVAAWQAGMRALHSGGAAAAGAERFLLELLWREFSWHLLQATPDLARRPLQKSFEAFPWREDAAGLRAWQSGMTGYPVIDAGMRQLWQTGWMHNRVRMIVASFLVKDLLIDWREGHDWFADTLVDADTANNAASWQWVAGCGADAAPYFRIFNPVLQGQKFDPQGVYVRRFVPELAKLDTAYIHAPWQAPAAALAAAGIRPGSTYPLPVVDHAKARQRALAALKSTQKGAVRPPESPDLFD